MLGGGPLGKNGILRPIYQKYYEEVLGLYNPAVSATAIPVRILNIPINKCFKCNTCFQLQGAIDTDELTVVAKNAVL